MAELDKLVSIVIVTWNGKKYIDECISSLLNQTYKKFEIVLVDNASSDDSVKYIRGNFPQVRVIENNQNLGFGEGVNIGIAHSRGDLIALLNQDAVADRIWLEVLVQALTESEVTAAAAGKVLFYGDEQGIDKVFCTWTKINPYTANPSHFAGDEPSATVDYLPGCAILVKRSIIQDVGLLDTEYFLYFEETDWCARMIRAGYELIYVPDAIVRHVVSGSSSKSTVNHYMIRNRIRFALKNFDVKYIPIFLFTSSTEMFFDFLRGIKSKDMLEFRIKIKAICWNINNLMSTLIARKRDLSRIRDARSYNQSLPLKKYPVGKTERFLHYIFR